VRDYNTLVESFPTNLVASLGGFQKAEFFELDDAIEREAPRVTA
jgi:LemA protein